MIERIIKLLPDRLDGQVTEEQLRHVALEIWIICQGSDEDDDSDPQWVIFNTSDETLANLLNEARAAHPAETQP